ncbi:hypothetical protein RJ640_014935, partial [Escallonia rubra]
MSARLGFFILLVSFVLLGVTKVCDAGLLSKNFYQKSCSQAEKLVRDITRNKTQTDSTLGAKLLRVHYHDCFVKGCDASILLDRVGTNQSEKEARPNLSLSGFEFALELSPVPDILALAARDSVSFPEPVWDVLTGRRDGRISLASEANGNLPSPFSDFNTLKQLFARKNLTVNDLVALSGAHTIGVAHCGAFSRRLFNFTGKGDTDPSINATYAESLKKQCPNPANPVTTVAMDPQSSLSFDTQYFTTLNQNKGLFQSDAALLTDRVSAKIVKQLQVPKDFFSEFGKSMKKMGAMEVLTGNAGEIRKNCRI